MNNKLVAAGPRYSNRSFITKRAAWSTWVLGVLDSVSRNSPRHLTASRVAECLVARLFCGSAVRELPGSSAVSRPQDCLHTLVFPWSGTTTQTPAATLNPPVTVPRSTSSCIVCHQQRQAYPYIPYANTSHCPFRGCSRSPASI